MELINSTRMQAGYTMGVEPSGRELLVVVVKGTFRIPGVSGQPVQLHEEQQPLVMSDEFFGEPGLSAPKYEVDFAPRKQRCDVLLNASAHAPRGELASRVNVGVRIGGWSKSFDVIGDRVWEAGATGIGLSPAVPFQNLPISYDRAFGGTDNRSEDPADHDAYLANPVGRGFHKAVRGEFVNGAPAPNTEDPADPVSWVNGKYRPMAFGVIGRHWQPRIGYAGTYDQQWMDDHFPFLPPDFDEQYYQAAPLDQQLPKPLGEQMVSLVGLTPDGRRDFLLPAFEAPIHVFPRKGGQEDFVAQADTIVIEPDLERLMITWRVARPLRRNMFEVGQVLVGRKGREWWQQRDTAFPVPVVVEPLERPAVEPAT